MGIIIKYDKIYISCFQKNEMNRLAVWGRAHYLSVTEAPHNTDFHTWMGKKHFCFFETAETGNRTPNSGVKGSGANHYPRAPALVVFRRGGIVKNIEKWYFKGKEIEVVSMYKYLGLIFTPKLNWSVARKTLASQANKALAGLLYV